jgi:hydroxypyruvate isomerase
MALERWGPVDANISMLFTEVPLTARPAAARAAGFTAVEVWWPFGSAVPAGPELAGFERAVRDAGVQLVALNGFAGNMQAGDRGILSWPGRQQEFLENLEVVLDLGARLGCRRFNLLYGNRMEGCAAAAQDELAIENLAVAARAARRAGAVVLVEPLSGIAQYPLRTAGDVRACSAACRPTAPMPPGCWPTSTTCGSTAGTSRPRWTGCTRGSAMCRWRTCRDGTNRGRAQPTWTGG